MQNDSKERVEDEGPLSQASVCTSTEGKSAPSEIKVESAMAIKSPPSSSSSSTTTVMTAARTASSTSAETALAPSSVSAVRVKTESIEEKSGLRKRKDLKDDDVEGNHSRHLLQSGSALDTVSWMATA